MITILSIHRIKNTNKVLRVLSGASCLCDVLVFENVKMIPRTLPEISLNEARELGGNV